MPHGKGARRSSATALAARLDVTRHVGVSAALATALPASFDLLPRIPSVADQGSTPCCFAHSTAWATAVAFNGALYVPSPKLIAAGATAIDRGTTGVATPLDDEGGTIESVNAFCAQFGVMPMGPSVEGRNSDVSFGNMNDEINMADLNAAGQRILTGQYGVDPAGANVSDTLAAALVAGLPIVTTFFCDSAFEALGGDMVAAAPDMSDPNGGGHAVYLSGYEEQNGERVFWLSNSWGTSWCQGGRCLVSLAWLAKVWELWPWAVAKGVLT